ncbi:hypothetical protein JTB14_033077 [Gonioctena quinquepunctata]|nr:hypothetical protein JTB14_033077 [Gonioctena quinquepunctata]
MVMLLTETALALQKKLQAVERIGRETINSTKTSTYQFLKFLIKQKLVIRHKLQEFRTSHKQAAKTIDIPSEFSTTVSPIPIVRLSIEKAQKIVN